MDKHINLGAFGHGGLSSIMPLLSMLEQAERNFKALPIEEQQRRTIEREENKEQRRVKFYVQQGRCPDCGNRLARGKKDKENDNKRTWKCECGKEFSF